MTASSWSGSGALRSQCISFGIAGCIGLAQAAVCRVLRRSDPDNPHLRKNWPGWRWMVPCVLIGAVVRHELGPVLAASLFGHSPQFMLAGTARQLLFGLGFTLLYLFGRGPTVDPMRPVADFWILAAAGAVPSLGFRLLKRSLDDRAALEVLNGDNQA